MDRAIFKHLTDAENSMQHATTLAPNKEIHSLFATIIQKIRHAEKVCARRLRPSELTEDFPNLKERLEEGTRAR